MKYFGKILLLACALASASGVHSQGLEIGPIVGVSSTWIVNPNMLIGHQDSKPEITLTGEYGAQMVLKLTKKFGLGGGVSFGKISQKYDWNEDTLSVITLETFNIPVFVRLGNRFYTDLGVQFTALNKGHLTILDEFEEDVSSTFRNNNLYPFMGLGFNIGISPNLRLGVGGRFGYGLYDIQGVAPEGYDFETLDDLAGIINSGGDVTTHPDYEEYAEYIGYFNTAQDFADNYERFNKTHSFYATVMATLALKF